MKKKIKAVLQFFLNPRLLLCLGIGWIITNGWSYVMFALGMYFNIEWMLAVSGAYLAFLWLPLSPEKLLTVTIAIFMLKFLFPKDEKTLGTLHRMKEKVKNTVKEVKQRRKDKKVAEKNELGSLQKKESSDLNDLKKRNFEEPDQTEDKEKAS